MDLDDEELKATRMMNGADRKGRIDKMEQDIKILEESIIQGKYHLYKKDLKKCVSNVINRNKELEEENENLKLKERNRVLGRYGEIEVHDLINKTLADDYIPVSLVEEKIEQYDEKRIKIEKDDIGVGFTLGKDWSDLKAKIQVLQELLEKRK